MSAQIQEGDVDQEKVVEFHYCFAKSKNISLDECFEICSERTKNRTYCVKNECKSPSRLCLACVRDAHNEECDWSNLDKRAYVRIHDVGKCAFHDENGYLAIRGGDMTDVDRMAKQVKDAASRVSLGGQLNDTGNDGVSSLIENIDDLEDGDPDTDFNDDIFTDTKRGKGKGVSSGNGGVVSKGEENVGDVMTELAALLSEDKAAMIEFELQVLEIPLEEILLDDEQPRDNVEKENVLMLAASIAVVGQLRTGVVVRLKGSSKHKYRLKIGEHRYKALKLLGKPTFRAEVLITEDADTQYIVAAIENIATVPYTEIEKAKMLAGVMERSGWNVERTAGAFAMTGVTAHQYLNILKLDTRCHKYIGLHLPLKKRITLSTVKVLAEFPKEEHLEHVLHIVGKKMTSTSANKYLEKKALEAGITFRTRRVSRATSHRSLLSYVDRVHAKMADYLLRDLRDIFKGRNRADRVLAASKLDALIRQLEDMKRQIQ